jgi:thiosulfate/3-mercaptopyruvate sulfurtransferase
MPMRRLAILLSLVLLWGCENDTSNQLAGPGDGDAADKTCLGCHSSEAHLRDALETTKDGPGGQVTELEAWEKVIITGANGDHFLAGPHGPKYAGGDRHPLTCQNCHGGAQDRSFASMDEAHAGMITDPSAIGEVACLQCHLDETWTTACDACHQEIVTASANSLHTNLWGFKNAIEERCAAGFGTLGPDVQAGFQASCASCHATCGQCHVSRPHTAGGGFPMNGVSLSHRFSATPDQDQQCAACHGTVGADFAMDVHGEAGQSCDSCHDAEELHGDDQHAGAHYENRFAVATMPRCEECHVTLDDNIAHIHHAGANPNCGQCHHNAGSDCDACHNGGIAFPFSYPLPIGQCQTCHAQPYRNCSNCHNLTADGDFDVDPPATQFKIARNANPERNEYDFVVVRHAPVAPATFAEWGLDLPSYSDEPTWTYAAPHNIQRFTTQNHVPGNNCFAACHGSSAGPQGYLLRESDLYEPDGITRLADYEANIGLVIPATFPHDE